MQKFFVPNQDIGKNNAVIRGQEVRHIARVLRLGKGDAVCFTNGEGDDFTGTIRHITRQAVTLRIETKKKSLSESPLHITVLQGMLKDRKMDVLIRHLTELGIKEWIPLFSERAVPCPDEERIDGRMRRWQKISVEALKQCNRSFVPEIARPVSLDKALETLTDYDLKIAFWENAVSRIQAFGENKKRTIRKVAVLIGPEGGFAKEEIDSAEASGFVSCFLGPRILRSETASITACAIVQHFFGDMA